MKCSLTPCFALCDGIIYHVLCPITASVTVPIGIVGKILSEDILHRSASGLEVESPILYEHFYRGKK